MLQKNYFLHQSAKDGYRSYLQAYASYSLKKIFDVNALDLAKVGKAFGFTVPPRVNVNIGEGKGNATKKRKRAEGEDFEPELEPVETVGADEDEAQEEDEETARKSSWRQSKERRVETLGRKKVEKEVYKKNKERQKMGANGQWSR